MYNNYNPLLLGLILERATGRPVTTYLQEKLWTPLGMEFDLSWSLDSEQSGFEKMESGFNAPAVDFAKFGRLYLNGGNWNGTQILPAEWVTDLTRDNGLIQDAPIYYGYMWWGENCNPDSQDFFALGNFGQFVYVSPANNMIIVRNGESYGWKASMSPGVKFSASSQKPCHEKKVSSHENQIQHSLTHLFRTRIAPTRGFVHPADDPAPRDPARCTCDTVLSGTGDARPASGGARTSRCRVRGPGTGTRLHRGTSRSHRADGRDTDQRPDR